MSASRIPLVDLKAQYQTIKPEIDAAIARVVESASFVLGQEVDRFESAFAGYCGVEHCIACANGTDALVLALEALGVGEGDEVITVSHTFFATVEAILSVGATPVFIDIREDTLLMDTAALETAVTSRSRAIIVVHLYGQMADMPRVMECAHRHGLVVIEDAAQSHGARIHGASPGVAGDIAAYSFYPGKNLGAYGDAGALVTRNPETALKARQLRDHGRTGKYEHAVAGRNSRMDSMQGAILSAKLPHLNAWNARRREIAAAYDAEFANLPVRPVAVAPGCEAVRHLYVVRVAFRNDVLAHLSAAGIGAGVHYPIPAHLQPALRSRAGQSTQLAVTEAAACEVLSLPLYPELTWGAFDRIVAVLRAAVDHFAPHP